MDSRGAGTINVFLADDNLIVRTGVRALIESHDDLRVVGVYAVYLLSQGSAGYGYLLKDHLAEGTQLVDAIRAVATGGTALDPAIVDALVRPVTSAGDLS